MSMKQKENRIIQKRRILDTAKQKFFEKGYEKTTVREILKEINMNIGSLYNFYKNKEDILLELTSELFDEAANAADAFVDGDDELLLSILIEIAIYLYAVEQNEHLVALYISAYKSYPISNMIVNKLVLRLQKALEPLGLDWAYEDYYLRIMALKGAQQSLLEEKLYGDIPIEFTSFFTMMFNMALPVFGVPQELTDATVNDALSLADTPKFKKMVNKLLAYP